MNSFTVFFNFLQFEYPTSWPTFFQDLIGALAQGEGIVDMFCRILVAVDEDIVSLDIPRSQEESKLSMHIKVVSCVIPLVHNIPYLFPTFGVACKKYFFSQCNEN